MLVAHGLTKAYQSATVVHDVNLEVAPGRIVGLVGANGAGKTTTLKMLAGLVEPTAGSVALDGRATTLPAARTGLGYLPEESPLYEELTPPAYLAFFGGLYGMARADAAERAAALLERLRCGPEHWKKPIGTLSKGLKRKVAIARCLLHRPRILILDEPTSGLDPFTTHELEGLLRDLRSEGVGVLLSAHNLPQLEELCDEILVMNAGRIVTRGTLAQLRGAHGPPQYRVRATVAFPGSSARGNVHEAWTQALPEVEGFLEHVRRAGGIVLEVESVPPSLDEILRKAVEA